MGGTRLHGRRRPPDGGLGPGPADQGHATGGRPAGGPHAADLHRHPRQRRGHRRRLRPAVRPPGQAARDVGLGRRPGPLETRHQGRPAVRARWRRRWLRDLRFAGGDHGAAGAGPAARALRGAHRGLRGVRQLRPARLRRPPGRPHRQSVARGVPGFGLRQLRPAVVHHLAARHGRRQLHGEGARGRGAFRRCVRGRAVELPPAAPVAVAPGGRGHRPDRRRRPACGDPRRAPCAGARGRAGARFGRVRQVPVPRWHVADGRGPHRTGAQPHLAPGAERDRRRRAALAVLGRQRAAAAHRREAVAPAAADGGRTQGRRTPQGRAAVRPAQRRPGHARAREVVQRLERAGDVGVAHGRDRWREPRVLRRARGVHGRRRLDPVHGHARREVPGRAVHDHRRAGPALQRARPERVPAHPDGQAGHRLRRAGDRRPPRGERARRDDGRRGGGEHPGTRRARVLLWSA